MGKADTTLDNAKDKNKMTSILKDIAKNKVNTVSIFDTLAQSLEKCEKVSSMELRVKGISMQEITDRIQASITSQYPNLSTAVLPLHLFKINLDANDAVSVRIRRDNK